MGLLQRRQFAALLLLLGCGAAITGSAQTTAVEPQTIVLFGASGRVGSRILHEALARGHRVTAVSRDPNRIAQQHDRLRKVAGDVLDPDAVAGIIAGSDAVISAIGGLNPDSDDPMQSIPRRAAESLVTALQGLGPSSPRLILVGGGSSTLAERPGVPFSDPEDAMDGPRGARVRGHRLALDLLLETPDIRWTFVSPALEMRPGERTGRYRTANGLVLRDDEGHSVISMEDYAVALLDEVEQARHINRQFNVAY
jgi:putative NADH-flavin reductase